MGVDCNIDGLTLDLTGVGTGTGMAPALMCVLFTTLSSFATSATIHFVALFCFGFGPIDLNGRVLIFSRSLSL